jgi:hypothetical protein
MPWKGLTWRGRILKKPPEIKKKQGGAGMNPAPPCFASEGFVLSCIAP